RPDKRMGGCRRVKTLLQKRIKACRFFFVAVSGASGAGTRSLIYRFHFHRGCDEERTNGQSTSARPAGPTRSAEPARPAEATEPAKSAGSAQWPPAAAEPAPAEPAPAV